MDWSTLPCSIYRGGTSKALLLRNRDLPKDPLTRDQLILSLFGSPDKRQINGLGGATPTTSKVGIIEVSTRKDADVDYTFGQVSIDKPYIDYIPNCGNVSAAVGPFAVEQGMVSTTKDGWNSVRIYNTNTKAIIVSRFMVQDHHFVPDGNTKIPGVPGTGSPVYLDFIDAGGGVTGKLFPTGNKQDKIHLPDGSIFRVTVIDIGNLTILMDGDELQLKGTEVSERELSHVLPTIEAVRQQVGRMLGIFDANQAVSATTHAIPKIALVQSVRKYRTTGLEWLNESDYDIVARAITMGNLHPTYPVTGGMALSVASKIPGTISFEKCSPHCQTNSQLRIGHPAGVLEMEAEVSESDPSRAKVTLVRTARPLISGQAWIPSFAKVLQ
ncbi:PrpF domain-containing protein [Alicyclobacillus suci]|uniref:PrpF domain-containing protein n=1 Tax=Alicyclobacillus suci TaxID=2816080 RepID=UPI001A904E0F|nr:PrpF domain-containing protein [Alicyclobacillus suci]